MINMLKMCSLVVQLVRVSSFLNDLLQNPYFREITRLHITMQHIFSKIIDSFHFYLSSVISLGKVALGNKTKTKFLVCIGQTKNFKICCFISMYNFCNFYCSTLVVLIQNWMQGRVASIVAHHDELLTQ